MDLTSPTLVDGLLILILVMSVAFAAWRGVVREVISLLGWLAAIVVAWLYGPLLAHWLPIAWSPAARSAIGIIATFLVTLVLAAVVGYAASRLIRAIGLGPVDRLLGAVFGLLRGAIVVVVLVTLVGLTPWGRAPGWQQSAVVPLAKDMVDLARRQLPARPPGDNVRAQTLQPA